MKIKIIVIPSPPVRIVICNGRKERVLHQSAIRNPQSAIAFTLIELLVVIAIIAILAALLMSAVGGIEKKSLIQRAQSEMTQLTTAINSYHAKLGYYPPSSGLGTPTTNQLYYELSGTTTSVGNNGTNFTTLDNSSTLSSSSTIPNFFGVSGFMNCTKGSGDDAVIAQNFLPSIKAGQIGTHTNGDGTATYVIVTAVHSDSTYIPLLPGFASLAGGIANPWRYVCPGVNNPNSYDLWVQIYVGGKTNLICNWFNQPKVNYPIE